MLLAGFPIIFKKLNILDQKYLKSYPWDAKKILLGLVLTFICAVILASVYDKQNTLSQITKLSIFFIIFGLWNMIMSYLVSNVRFNLAIWQILNIVLYSQVITDFMDDKINIKVLYVYAVYFIFNIFLVYIKFHKGFFKSRFFYVISVSTLLCIALFVEYKVFAFLHYNESIQLEAYLLTLVLWSIIINYIAFPKLMEMLIIFASTSCAPVGVLLAVWNGQVRFYLFFVGIICVIFEIFLLVTAFKKIKLPELQPQPELT